MPTQVAPLVAVTMTLLGRKAIVWLATTGITSIFPVESIKVRSPVLVAYKLLGAGLSTFVSLGVIVLKIGDGVIASMLIVLILV